jgi:cystathionine beta-lyase/cystathionine gamma-synthase
MPATSSIDSMGVRDSIARQYAANHVARRLVHLGEHQHVIALLAEREHGEIRRVLSRYGIAHTMLSIEDVAGIERTLAERPTRLIVFESPTNPLLKIAALERMTAAARAHGALTLLDNTFAGFHNHGQFDIDIFAHSLTKYASGHGDVMGGAVIARKELIDAMHTDSIILGATLDPHAAFMIQRGLKTYPLRYERQAANALKLAVFLEAQPQVARVSYPGLPSHPQHALAARQMHEFGAMVTVELREDAARFSEALQLFAISASLGSTESLVWPGRLINPRDLSAQERLWAGISERTARLSIGIEDADDLIADLQQALATSGTASK